MLDIIGPSGSGMELRHLRHFVAVAEELHFARAAERLGIEQSPLSHSIRNLEAALGVKLLHRTTRRTWLTRAGERFHREAARILADVDTLNVSARDESFGEPCRLAFGLAEHAAGEPFTRLLFELEHREPPLAVDLREIAPADVAGHVRDRRLDLCLTLAPVDAAGLRRVRAWAEPLMLIAPLGHSLAEREHVTLPELGAERFVLPQAAASPGCAAQVEMLLDRHGVRPARVAVVKHQNTMVSFVSAGRGLALLPESIAHGLTTVAVLPLAEPDAKIVSWLVYREGDASDGVLFALEIASVIDGGGALSSEAASEL